MHRLRFGGTVGLGLHRLAALEQAALRRVQRVVGGALVAFEPGDRLPRFLLAGVLIALLLLRRTALGGGLLPLAGRAIGGLRGGGDLQLEADDRLLLDVQPGLERAGRRLGRGNRRVERGDRLTQAVDDVLLRLAALAQFLDLALGGEDAARLGALSALDDPRAVEDVAVQRHHRSEDGADAGQHRRYGARLLEIAGNPGAGQDQPNRRRGGPRHADDVAQRRQAGGRVRRAVGVLGRLTGNHESDAAGIALADEPQSGGGMGLRLDDDVLQPFAEAGFDGALVPPIDLEIVGDRSHLADALGRLGENGACSVAVLGAGGIDLLERRQTRDQRRELVLASSQLEPAGVALRPRLRQHGFARRALAAQLIQRRAGAAQAVVGGGTLAGGPLGFDGKVAILDLERRDALGHARPCGDRVLHRVAQRRRRVDHGEHLAARRLDVRLQALDLTLGVHVGRFLGRQRARGLVAILRRAPGGGAARLELDPGRFLPRVERTHLGLDVGSGGGQLLDLLAVECDLLLQPSDLQLAGVRRRARGGGLAVGFGQLEAQALERGLQLGDPGRG